MSINISGINNNSYISILNEHFFHSVLTLLFRQHFPYKFIVQKIMVESNGKDKNLYIYSDHISIYKCYRMKIIVHMTIYKYAFLVNFVSLVPLFLVIFMMGAR